jgi:hypothetical protein
MIYSYINKIEDSLTDMVIGGLSKVFTIEGESGTAWYLGVKVTLRLFLYGIFFALLVRTLKLKKYFKWAQF